MAGEEEEMRQGMVRALGPPWPILPVCACCAVCICKQIKALLLHAVQIEMPSLDWRRCAQLGRQKTLSLHNGLRHPL